MSIILKQYGSLELSDLSPDFSERSQRLGCDYNKNSELFADTEKELLKNIKIRYSYVKTDVEYSDDFMLDIGFGLFFSQSLYNTLYPCKQCYIFCVTLGNENERYLTKLSVLSPAGHFIADALSSAIAEEAANAAEKAIKGEENCTERFSAGYGDLDLRLQKDILNITDAGKLLGITLGSSFIMTPTKTITAIMGIKK